MLRSGLFVCFLVCTAAHAQESTSTLEAFSLSSPSNTSTIAAPVLASPWKLSLGSESFTYEMDQRNHGSQAAMISSNWIGALYQASPIWAFELRQMIQYASSLENLGPRDQELHQDNHWALAETVLRAAAKPGWTIGSSSPVQFDLRYYAPTDRASQANHELGRLRADAYAEWLLNTKWTVAGWASYRVLLNGEDNPDTTVGADAGYYQVKAAPYFIYNWTDRFQSYYAYTYSGKSSTAQRGDVRADMHNLGSHEVGLYATAGSFLINPSIMSDTNLNGGSGSLISSDSRAFAYETLSYNFNVYATF